jgi:hypothetical protein
MEIPFREIICTRRDLSSVISTLLDGVKIRLVLRVKKSPTVQTQKKQMR